VMFSLHHLLMDAVRRPVVVRAAPSRGAHGHPHGGCVTGDIADLC
jgi:hypothetical protein